jgi:hypothetical protein
MNEALQQWKKQQVINVSNQGQFFPDGSLQGVFQSAPAPLDFAP